MEAVPSPHTKAFRLPPVFLIHTKVGSEGSSLSLVKVWSSLRIALPQGQQ